MSDVSEMKLRTLTLELKKLTDPINLGVGLGFPDHELAIIKRDNPQDVEDQKFALFSKISRNYRSMQITWDKIADCLERFVKDRDLAMEIRRKFCQVDDTTENRVDEIARAVGIDPQILDKPCDDKPLLLKISKLLEHWQSYAEYLGLSEQELNVIQRDVSLSAYHQKSLKMLERWQEKKAYTPEANYRHLLNGCIEVNENAKLVGEICKLLK